LVLSHAVAARSQEMTVALDFISEHIVLGIINKALYYFLARQFKDMRIVLIKAVLSTVTDVQMSQYWNQQKK
jgi:hypothetical protein